MSPPSSSRAPTVQYSCSVPTIPMSITSAPSSAMPRAYSAAMLSAESRMSRPSPHGELLDRRVLKIGEHARKAATDPVGELLVHLLRVGAPDVVGLEDRGVDHRDGFYRKPRRRK